MKRIKGFTLIELLIVVAIIAILAAIAIPNFLAAQIRAKVSKVRAEQATVVTALECYMVDNNTYPMANRYTTAVSGAQLGSQNFRVPYSLTTPIAYITSTPIDPFGRYANLNNPLKYITAGTIWNNGVLYDWYLDVPQNWPAFADENTPTKKFYGPGDPRNEISPNLRWFLFSVGPCNNLLKAYGLPQGEWYDPTNGTVSNGNIVRTSDGYGFK